MRANCCRQVARCVTVTCLSDTVLRVHVVFSTSFPIRLAGTVVHMLAVVVTVRLGVVIVKRGGAHVLRSSSFLPEIFTDFLPNDCANFSFRRFLFFLSKERQSSSLARCGKKPSRPLTNVGLGFT